MSALRSWSRGAVAALAFLTRVPVGRQLALDGDDVARGAPFFPLVGAGVGALVGVVAQELARPLTPLLAAAIALLAMALVTGVIHLDSVADTADAAGGHDREHALTIMRDHRVGAYGAVALVLDLGIRAAALAALSARDATLVASVAAGALGRSSAPAIGATLPYARTGGGLGAPFAGRALDHAGLGAPCSGGALLRAGLGVAVAAAFACGLAGSDGAILCGASVALWVALRALWRRWLGGVTGDALGAGIEATELLVLVVAVALARHGGLA